MRFSFQVVQKFKAGEFNVLVATSIGEEGLDIGEVDLIVCYDAQKTPIRMVMHHLLPRNFIHKYLCNSSKDWEGLVVNEQALSMSFLQKEEKS